MNTTRNRTDSAPGTEDRPPQIAHWYARKARMPAALGRAFWRQAVADAEREAAPASAEAHAAAVRHMHTACCDYVQGRARTVGRLLHRIGAAYARRALRSDAALLAHVVLFAALGALIAS